MEYLRHISIGLCTPTSTTLLHPRKPSKLHHPSTSVFCSASKWAERLLADFQFLPATDNYSSSSSSTATVSPPFPPLPNATFPFPSISTSQDPLISRRQILHAACETLSNPGSRRNYNQGLVDDERDTIITQVPWEKVPGALCMLQEAGETEAVLQIRETLLRERMPKAFKQDVVLAMALAFVDLSRDAMALNPPHFIGGCEVLERALKLLQEEGASSLAPDLQSQIDETLEEIAPLCVLELLALPLDDEHQTKREEGLHGVRNILWAVGGGGVAAIAGGFTRENFMNEAFLCMTAAERVDLFAATPRNISAESFEVYGVALALVAQAFLNKKPHLIRDADNLFQQLQQTKITTLDNSVSPYTPIGNHEIDFALERGLRSLLVGELDECRMWLGLDNDSSRYRNPSIVDFVLENSKDDDDRSSWALQTFGGMVNGERIEGAGGSPLAAAAAIVRIGAEATAVLDHVKTSAIQALQKVFPLHHSEESDSAMLAEVPGISSLEEIYDEETITDKIKKASIKIMSAGVKALFSIKSEAFGPDHRLDKLPEPNIVDNFEGLFKASLGLRAFKFFLTLRKLPGSGCLMNMSIDSVTLSLDGQRAVVEATLEESTFLTDVHHPENNASNLQSYTTRYEMSCSKSGWKITEGSVYKS
ncbi:Chaperone DnaJ-domain superfamily protein isoform 2 [Hibiscus syriacus]|uniref:Chaperone DnaJ-domain superfamily protein isoform 2 n=1 Tax=Hibiscus syriacus TaxID=106335 RepID=A0A6A2XRD5_HIBSY|nr:Chaperone DnaJ-domain superfamily protein isoform 2 [Hibiscus syriacus]